MDSNDNIATDEVQSDSVPIWNKPTLPADAKIFILVNEQNFDFGGMIEAAYRLDISRVIANNSVQGAVYTVVDEEAEITVPSLTVVPAYKESFDPYSLQRAQATSSTSKARFLLLGTNPNVDGGYLAQSAGFYTFPENHAYSIGATYYLSEGTPGGVTTTAPSLAQPLFYVVDERTIAISIGA